jgi:hypothetical protein
MRMIAAPTRAAMPSLHTGPFACHGAFNFYLVMSLFFVWIVVVTHYALNAVDRIRSDERVASAVG